MSGLLRRKFQLFLSALILLVIVYPIFRSELETRLLFGALVTGVFLGALLLFFTQTRLRVVAVLLGLPMALGAWTDYTLPGLPQVPVLVSFHLLAALFLTFTIATILRSTHRQETISADSVYGAFCGYLLIGVGFGHIYCVIEALSPGSFRGLSEVASQHSEQEPRYFQLIYFSFATLTTVGYGDISAAREASRSLVIVEAILGQFYIAVLIAELIGKRVAQVVSRP